MTMTMKFFHALVSGANKRDREMLKRYVDMEYRPSEREAAYKRLLREAEL